MDIYNIAEGEETTTQSMAEAVERSVVFLMCVSETYKDSLFCRQGQSWFGDFVGLQTNTFENVYKAYH